MSDAFLMAKNEDFENVTIRLVGPLNFTLIMKMKKIS